MYQVTITGTKDSVSYQGIGSLSQIKEGARVKAFQLQQRLGDDIRIRVEPIDAFIAITA